MRIEPKILLALLLCSSASHASDGVQVPEKPSATCNDLALITFWESTGHLSAKDKKRAEAAVADPKTANRLRPAIGAKDIEAVKTAGYTAHGNAGSGLTNLDSAREDAIVGALQAYELCIEGRFEYGHAGESDRWWER